VRARRDGQRREGNLGQNRDLNSLMISRGRTRPNVPTSGKFKTELCHYLMELSQCPFGTECTYAHTMDELRSIDRHPRHRTQKCRDYTNQGYCPFGERCSFIHEKESPDDLLEQIYQNYKHLAKIFGSEKPKIVVTQHGSNTYSRVNNPDHQDIEECVLMRPPTASSGYGSPCSMSPAVSPTPDAVREPFADAGHAIHATQSALIADSSPVTRRTNSLGAWPLPVCKIEDDISFGSLPCDFTNTQHQDQVYDWQVAPPEF